MKKRSFIIFLFFLTPLIFSWTSCGKIAFNKLEGQWRLIPVHNMQTSDIEEWWFTDGFLQIYVNFLKKSEAQYATAANFAARTEIIITDNTNPDYKNVMGNWKILTLNGEVLSMIKTENGMMSKEFEKVSD